VKSTPAPSEGLQKFFGTRAGHVSLSAIAGYFHATIEGGENIPRSGGALIVSNHALFALDAAVLGALLIRDYGRFPRFLGDRNLWRIPGLRELITAIGALPGEPQAAEELLRQGELVIVYPGGVDDSLKLSSQRYQLQWKTRAGFARVAVAAQVPIIPVVGYGIDDMYTVLAREHLIGRRILGSPRYDLPIGFGAFGTILPRRSVQTYLALPPIDTQGCNADSQADVERIRAAAYEALDSHLRAARESSARAK
jgi:1-acyl-sn-glycerol-3-phosphate acyltransferase